MSNLKVLYKKNFLTKSCDFNSALAFSQFGNFPDCSYKNDEIILKKKFILNYNLFWKSKI